MYRYHHLVKIRTIALLIVILALLTQTGCTATRPPWSGQQHRRQDLSKIYIDFVTSNSDAISIEARKNLKQAIRKQLLDENMLQEDPTVHSLSLKAVILSYENNILEVQAELYDDDAFLVFSRVKRQVLPNDNWAITEQLVAEQLLDELMINLRAYSAYLERLRPNVIYVEYPYDPYYNDYGWWRHKPTTVIVNQPPTPVKHWVADAIKEKLPRSHVIAAEVESRKPGESTPSHWGIPSTHSMGSYSTDWNYGSGSSYSSGSNSGGQTPQNDPVYEPPHPTPSVPSHPDYSAPSSHPGSSSPRPIESSTPKSSESPTRSGVISGAAPSSHKRKKDDDQ